MAVIGLLFLADFLSVKGMFAPVGLRRLPKGPKCSNFFFGNRALADLERPETMINHYKGFDNF